MLTVLLALLYKFYNFLYLLCKFNTVLKDLDVTDRSVVSHFNSGKNFSGSCLTI